MKGSKIVIAVNKHEYANIFQVAGIYLSLILKILVLKNISNFRVLSLNMELS